MSGQLERLLAEATPGERGVPDSALVARMRLSNLSLDLARLLVDAMARLKSHNCPRKLGYQLRVKEVARDTYRQVSEPEELPVESCPVCVLLARFAEVEQQAGEGQG